MGYETLPYCSEALASYHLRMMKDDFHYLKYFLGKPVLSCDLPDPTAAVTTDGKVVIVGTQGGTIQRNLQRIVFDGTSWSKEPDPALVYENGLQCWAPELFGPLNGLYWIVYTEVDSQACISRLRLASSTSLTDLFIPHPDILIEGRGIHHIDPQITYDPLTNSLILIEGSGWNRGDGIRMWIMDMETMKIKEGPYQIVENDPEDPEACLWEAGYLQIVPESLWPYQLHFSGTDYKRNYSGKLQVARHPEGPYRIPPQWEDDTFLSNGSEMMLPGQVSFLLENLFVCHAVEANLRNDENFVRYCLMGRMKRDIQGLPIPMKA